MRSGNTKVDENTGPVTLTIGAGIVYSASVTNFQQGNLSHTDRPLDLGIDGAGFFQVKTPDGEMSYTRAGAFQIDGAGQFADMQGNILQTSSPIPSGAQDLAVLANGDVTGVMDGESMVFGQIVLASFQNPEGLQRNKNNLFVPTVNSGELQVGQPGSPIGNQVLGAIRGHSLEESNVDIAVSMTDLIQVQRAYQMNARLIQNGDQMWGIANAMRR